MVWVWLLCLLVWVWLGWQANPIETFPTNSIETFPWWFPGVVLLWVWQKSDSVRGPGPADFLHTIYQQGYN